MRLGLPLWLWGQLPGEQQPGPPAPAPPPQSYLAPLQGCFGSGSGSRSACPLTDLTPQALGNTWHLVYLRPQLCFFSTEALQAKEMRPPLDPTHTKELDKAPHGPAHRAAWALQI
jgi:hypothetical protein